jgi:putative flippase GtrA
VRATASLRSPGLDPVMPTTDLKEVAGTRSAASVGRKLGRFLLVGGFCTALQYILLTALVEGLAMSATLASTIGYIVSASVNYVLNYFFTFESAARHRRSLPRFWLITGCGLVLNGAVTYIGTTIYGAHYLVAQAAATCVTLLWNFFANLRWTF